MDIIKSYSRRSFLLILVFMVLLAGVLTAATYYGTSQITQTMSSQVKPDLSPTELMARVNRLHDTYAVYLISLSAVLMILGGIVLWLVLRGVAKRILTETGPVKPKAKKAKATAEQKEDKQPLQNQRLFLHLLIVLQREGRLVDFLQEDLNMYEDEQIGAAVRNIHGSCRKILTKSLAMEPIIDGSEGEEISVKPGFDPDAIKLTGRVTGEPPFKGIIRHKGWRARKLELPDLSADKDPAIISPAEVEIE